MQSFPCVDYKGTLITCCAVNHVSCLAANKFHLVYKKAHLVHLCSL